VFGFSVPLVRAGALLGIGVEPADQGQQTAELTERLLKPLPATSPDPTPKIVDPRCQFAVNLLIAEKLGVPVPDTLAKRAKYQVREK
jgi:ABC-type uncharacterized transport system substrate-binding protein